MSQTHQSSQKLKRSSSSDQNFIPVTPQRVNRVQKQLRAASSPLTPGYSSATSSPLSTLTNTYSSPLSVATPSSSISSGTRVNLSPENAKIDNCSVADSVSNWRVRAKENGIKVSLGENTIEEMQLASNDMLPSSFHSTQRRLRASQFQAKSSDIAAITSPFAARMHVLQQVDINTPSPRKPMSNLNTPSPRTSRAIVERLKAKGSLTDPAQPRRKLPFGAISGEGLFDIDENSAHLSPYLQTYGSPLPTRAARLRSSSESGVYLSQNNANNNTTNSSEIKFQLSILDNFRDYQPTETSTVCSDDHTLESLKISDSSKGCSVCSSTSLSLSSLIPCNHLVCSSCLTGALNIVGEKDMKCVVCETVVQDFKLLTPLRLNNSLIKDDAKVSEQSPAISLLPSVFEEYKITKKERNHFDDFMSSVSKMQSTSPPKFIRQNSSSTDLAVLRIDNVPWDVTPVALSDFFKPSVIDHAHVLLDPKGKTLSHAYVELPNNLAKQALRTVQNKTMGKGKRLRGVTVTMSSQSELMRSLFPSWKGTFDGSRPSLVGLDRNAVVNTLETGLISLNELDSLITLMRKPDSHFLKVPSLPYYSLASILTKFPADVDSRVFWTSTLRDLLYHLTLAAIETLSSRLIHHPEEQALFRQLGGAGTSCEAFTLQQRSTLAKEIESTSDKVSATLTFESRSVSTATESDGALTPADIPLSMVTSVSDDIHSYAHTTRSGPNTLIRDDTVMPAFSPIRTNPESYDTLAREFGIEPNLVHALAQRLSAVQT